MELDALKHYIQAHLECKYIKVSGDGRHFDAVIVSPTFEGCNTLKRQQKIYAFLSEKIATGELHAFTMKTYTPAEWQQQENLNG